VEPAPPKPEPKPEKPPESEQSKPAQPVGDLAMAKTEPVKKPDAEPPKPSRPRKLIDVPQRNPSLAGQKMFQEGGVERHSRITTLSARGTESGQYDWRLVQAVQNAWYLLIDQSKLNAGGKVVVTFKLFQDGRVSDVKVAESSVSGLAELFCQWAIERPGSSGTGFGPWTDAMRREVGNTSRDIRFTFFYEE
jgi:outer membrane biosynthesis protein TonB